MDAEEHNLGGRRDSAYLLSDFKAIHYGYAEIQNYDIWDESHNLSKCLLAVGGFATHLPLWISAE